MENSYDVVLNETVRIDAFKSYKKGELKLTKIGDNKLKFDFDFPIVEFTEAYIDEEDRDLNYDIIIGARKGSVG